jgi:hypothetical protein
VPAEIERLEDVRRVTGAGEEIVPLVFEGVEVLPVCDQMKIGGARCLANARAQTAGCGPLDVEDTDRAGRAVHSTVLV